MALKKAIAAKLSNLNTEEQSNMLVRFQISIQAIMLEFDLMNRTASTLVKLALCNISHVLINMDYS